MPLLTIAPEVQTAGIVLASLGAVVAIMKVFLDAQTAALKLHMDNAILLHEKGCKASDAFADAPTHHEQTQSGRHLLIPPSGDDL